MIKIETKAGLYGGIVATARIYRESEKRVINVVRKAETKKAALIALKDYFLAQRNEVQEALTATFNALNPDLKK